MHKLYAGHINAPFFSIARCTHKFVLASLRLVLLVWTQSNRPIYIENLTFDWYQWTFQWKTVRIQHASNCCSLVHFFVFCVFVFVLLRSNLPYHFILNLNCAVYLYCAYILTTHNIALLFFSHACTVNPCWCYFQFIIWMNETKKKAKQQIV